MKIRLAAALLAITSMSTIAQTFLTALSGEWKSKQSPAGNTLGVSELQFADEKVKGKGSFNFVGRETRRCNRDGQDITGTYTLDDAKEIATLSIVYPADKGGTCDPISITFKHNKATGEFVNETETGIRTLRPSK
jgi:hypothetical protein